MFPSSFSADVVSEFVDADLGDARRSERLPRIVEKLSREPSASFPTAMQTSAETEAFYRFVNNPAVDASDVLTPHIDASLARAHRAGEVVCIHDTTDVEYSGDSRRGLGITHVREHHGYMAHCSLAVSADDTRIPLGMLAVETFVRSGKKKSAKGSVRAKSKYVPLDPERESLRWWRSIEEVEELRGSSFDVIHVMDAEADFFDVLARMADSTCRYIVRAGQLDRLVDHGAQRAPLRDVLDRMQPSSWRDIEVGERKDKGRRLPAKQRQRHAPRTARPARVAMAATTVRLPRTRYCDVDLEHVELRVVRVWEPSPPDGEAAVEWVLFTSEPIADVADIERVVDRYRLRWIIEEFFKALKSGCAIEKRQLESYDALCKVLALFIPVAYRLLLLRGIEHAQPNTPASVVFTPTELHVLANAPATRGPLPTTVKEAFDLIARLGGHLKHNGRPGWQVLGRGYEKLLEYCIGYEIAKSASAT